MTPLDLLLTILRMSVVGGFTLGLGHLLLRRRPDAVPAVALAGLLAGCGVLATTGSDWTIVWHSSVSTEVLTEVQPSESTAHAPSTGFGLNVPLAQIGQLLKQLDRPERFRETPFSGVYAVTALVCLFLAVGIVRVCLGALATMQLHRTSRVVDSERLGRLISFLVSEGRSGEQLEDGDERATTRERRTEVCRGRRFRKLAPALGYLFQRPADAVPLTVRVSDRITAPCVAAVNRRSIYLPEGWEEFSDEELMAVLAHELGHLKRSDAGWRLLAQLAMTTQYFHPLAHRLLRQLVLGQELASDQWAAGLLGHEQFIRGISRLALRLDAGTERRLAHGIGLSHSSSFLIRRIKMLRNGVPEFDRRRSLLVSGVTIAAVTVAAVVSSAWTLSAEEPVRVAARIDPITAGIVPKHTGRPWEVIPGHSGYWSLNVKAVLKHPVMGPWLRLADSQFLSPGWVHIAREEAAGRRGELGLSLDNLDTIAGTLELKNDLIEGDEDGHDFSTVATSSRLTLNLKNDVDWIAVGEALAEDRLDAAIKSLASPSFPEEEARKLAQQDTIAGFFEDQTNPRQLLIHKTAEEEEQTETSPAILALWNQHAGNLATMVTEFQPMKGTPATPIQKLAESLYQSGDYYVVAIDTTERPENVLIRVGVSPRSDASPQQLVDTVTALKSSSIEKLRSEAGGDESTTQLERDLLKQLEECEPRLVESVGNPDATLVLISLEVPAGALWWFVAG